MKRIFALTVAVVALLLVSIPIASAAVIDLPIDTVVKADVGSTTVLGTHATPSDLVGEDCVVTAEAENQNSVHPGNNLLVESGSDSITLVDVERSAGAVTEASDHLTLGSTITVSLHMGQDGIFSGGLIVSGECPPPTTTTTTAPPTPAIIIEKTATADYYGEDGIGHFTIEVTNPGPVDLTQVHVTDDIALATDPNSDCENQNLPDLAVGESYTYQCAIANLNGVSPFTNEATAYGTGPDGTEVTDTDDATVFPPVLSTTITTQPPTTAPPVTEPPPTLPNTGVPFEQVRGFSIAGVTFLLAGIALLGTAAVIGQRRVRVASGHHHLWLQLKPKPYTRTLYIRLHRDE